MSKNINKKYDVAIIGGGISGLTASYEAVSNGLSVCLFEKNNIGGLSLNVGDLVVTKMFDYLEENDFKNKKHTDDDLKKVYESVLKERELYLNSLERVLSNKELFHLVNGTAKVTSNETIDVDGTTYHFDNLIIASGKMPRVSNLDGQIEARAKGSFILTNELTKIKEIPKNLVVYGGGRIATQVGLFFSNIGSKVTVLSKENALTDIDLDVKEVYLKIIANDNFEIIENVSDVSIKGKNVFYELNGKKHKVKMDIFFNAIGFVNDFSTFEILNLETNNRGIIVNEHCQTSISNIYAIGDVTNNDSFSIVGVKEAKLAVGHILNHFTNITPHDFIKNALGPYQFSYFGYNENDLMRLNIPYVSKIITDKTYPTTTDNIKYVKILINKTNLNIEGGIVISKEANSHLNAILLSVKDNVLTNNEERFNMFSEAYHIGKIMHQYYYEFQKELIDNNHEIFYKPLFNKNNQVIGAHLTSKFIIDGNILSAKPFIETFENSNLINYLDLKVLRTGDKVLNDLHAVKKLPNDFTIFAKGSPLTLSKLGYETLAERIKINKHLYKHASFDVTIQTLGLDLNFAHNLEELKHYGFKISLDNFLSSGESVNLHRNVNFDFIKIDSSLLPKKKDDIEEKTYRSLINLLKNRDVDIIAVGIENEYQLEYAKSLRIKGIEGSYLSKDLTYDEFMKLF